MSRRHASRASRPTPTTRRPSRKSRSASGRPSARRRTGAARRRRGRPGARATSRGATSRGAGRSGSPAGSAPPWSWGARRAAARAAPQPSSGDWERCGRRRRRGAAPRARPSRRRCRVSISRGRVLLVNAPSPRRPPVSSSWALCRGFQPPCSRGSGRTSCRGGCEFSGLRAAF